MCILPSEVMSNHNGRLGYVESSQWPLLCQQQSAADAWASELSISAAALLLRRPILVYTDCRMGVFRPVTTDTTLQPVRLWCDGQHFQVVKMVCTEVGGRIASVPAIWRGGGRKGGAKRALTRAPTVPTPMAADNMEVDVSDGVPRVIPSDDHVGESTANLRCKAEETSQMDENENTEADLIATMRMRRSMPGAARSKVDFDAMFNSYETTFTQSSAAIRKAQPDSGGCISARVNELYGQVDGRFPMLKDLDPRLRRALVCLLACYRLRITDYVILEQVTVCHI